MTVEPQLITERERVIEAVTTLFVSIDKRDWGTVRSGFTENVLFNTTLTEGNPEILPRDQIIGDWQEGLECLEAIHHQVGNFLVRFHENEAIVFCYGIAYHYLPNRSNRNTKLFVGSYDIRLVSQDGGWKITAFTFNSKFVAGNLKLGE
ncbi:MAG: nuclear transport factor 2 family protein [Methanomicrobiales archaeon]